jgi:dihydroorotate dehydrogenase (NAD+) catalytic subunit
MLEGKFFDGGLSGPAIKPMALKAVRQIREKVDIDIAACGGICSMEDIEDYKKTGAKAFVLGSILLSQPDIIRDWI